MKITENTLLVDNVSEALYQCIEEGSLGYSMLVCEINGTDGDKYKVHIKVTRDETVFIDNDEEMPVFNHDENYRLTD